jgi:hypothetical protein
LLYLPSGTNNYFLLAGVASTSLTTATIRSETKVVEDGVWHDCSMLASFVVETENANYSTDGKALFNKDQTTLIDFAPNAGTSYSVPSTVTAIGDFAFFSYNKLTAVVLPSSLTSIGDEAFYSCEKLATMNYNDTQAQWAKVTLGDNWHKSCTLLTAVTCTDGSVTL